MTRRGRILRDTNAGPGLLTIEGKQYSFVLEGMWRSEVPPRTGMPVDVQFDAQGAPEAVVAVGESQLAREQADQALQGMKRQGGELARKTFARFGVGTVVGWLALAAGWFLLTTVSLGGGGEGMDVSFWHLLGFANESRSLGNLGGGAAGIYPSSGAFGMLALAALAGPLLNYFWQNKKAALGGALPLLFMVVVFAVLRHNILLAAGAAGGFFGKDATDRMLSEFMAHVTFGLGLYVSAIAALYFTFTGVKRFLVAGVEA